MERKDLTNIKPQIPAEGIMKTHDFGDSKYYRIACECGRNDHDVDFCVEADECGITLQTYTTVKTAYWRNTFDIDYGEPWLVINAKTFANDWINRFRIIRDALFKGYIEFDGSTIMNKQQAVNFVAVIENAMVDVEQFREKGREKRKAKDADY